MISDFINNLFTLISLKDPSAKAFFADRVYVQNGPPEAKADPFQGLLVHLEKFPFANSKHRVIEIFEIDADPKIIVAVIGFEGCDEDFNVSFFLRMQSQHFQIISLVFV